MPSSAEDLIQLLEKIQKDSQANEFFKKIFEQDPVASENKFLSETVQNLQNRLQESEYRHDVMQKLNLKLANELGKTLDELEALKKTVIGSHSLVLHDQTPENKIDTIEPSYLRIMQAEQLLEESFIYDQPDQGD